MLFEIFDFQASDFILKTSVDWDALSDDAQLSDTTQAAFMSQNEISK